MKILLFATDPSGGHGAANLLNDIGLCVIVAAGLAFIANKFKQPALLAYLLAGVLIGPEIGFSFITDHETIEVISEIGLVAQKLNFERKISHAKAQRRKALPRF